MNFLLEFLLQHGDLLRLRQQLQHQICVSFQSKYNLKNYCFPFLKKDISIVIAPEGTFNMTHKPLKEFYDGAFKIAIETQTPIKPVLFLDTYDRMHYGSIFSMQPGRSRSVYLEEIPVDGLVLEDVGFLKEKVYKIMEEKLVGYKASWIKQAIEKTN